MAKTRRANAVTRRAAISARSEPDKSDRLSADLTPKQWLYLDAVEELIAKGPLPSQTQLSRSLRIARTTISMWRRSRRFMEEFGRVLRSRIEVGDALCDMANQRMAQQGSAKHYELNLRRRGLYDALPPELPSANVNHGVQVGSVAFYGLPAPPTPAEAERLRPPAASGSAMVLATSGVLEDGSKQERKP